VGEIIAVLFFAALLLLAPKLLRRPRNHGIADDDDDAVSREEVGVIAIEDAIDLHGFRPRDIPDVVRSYLEAASAKGFSEVRLIHGRGKGAQRQRVREVLARHPLVEHFKDAPAHRGGWGATVVTLRPRS
jgi:dsDNA-specific endonuclease/ATPase MutS2